MKSTNVFTNSCIYASFLFLPLSLLSQSYSVEGTLTYRAFGHDKVNLEIQRKVAAHVSGPQWLLRFDSVPAAGVYPLVSTCSAGFDGEALYNYGTAASVGSKPPGAGEAPQILSQGAVQKNGIPWSLPTVGTAFLWFALVPGAFTNVLHDGSGECIWYDELLHKHHVKFAVNISTNSLETSYSLTAVWMNDGKIRYEDDKRNLLAKPWPFPYTLGYTNAIYIATFRKSGEVILPDRATLTSFVPDYPSDSASGKALQQESYSLQVTRVQQPCQIEEFRPELPRMCLVRDMRMVAVDPTFVPVTLVSNGGAWQSPTLADLNKQYAEFKKFAIVSRGERPSAAKSHIERMRRQITTAALFLVAVATLLAVLRTKGRLK